MKSWQPLLLMSLAVTSALAKVDVAAKAREIDALLAQSWAAQGLQANAPADDFTWVRRLYLDAVGRIPTVREADAFLQSTAADKRSYLIGQLLASEGQVQHAFNYWADVLRLQTSGVETGKYTGFAYSLYLKDSLRANKPYDQLVRELITAQGKAWDNGAVGYYMRDRNMPLDNLANTARIFLGTRIECAQCHNHPFDKWTQMHFYQLAALPYVVQVDDYFTGNMSKLRSWMEAREQALKTAAPTEKYRQVVEENGYMAQALNTLRNYIRYTEQGTHEPRVLRLPHDYAYNDAKPFQAVTPASLMGHAITQRPSETPLDAYARWLTSPEHPRFTTVIVNRLWKRAFGLALIEPLDELTDASAAANPALLLRLEQTMRELKYDLRAFMAVVFHTRAYQSQVTREEIPPGVAYHFTGPLLRRMSPEQIWDSFITLINPSPDAPNARVRHHLENRILAPKKLVAAIDALSLDELIAGMRSAAAMYKERAVSTPTLQRELSELTAKGDTRAAQATRNQLNHLLFDPHGVLNHEVVHRGMAKLASQLGGTPVVYRKGPEGALTETAASLDVMKATTGTLDPKDHVFITGHFDRPELPPEEAEALRASRQSLWRAEAVHYHIPEAELADYFRAREAQTDLWLRSADLESPSPVGHYLREFGQSDRQLIENANHDASIPQALALMNGELMPQILAPYSQVMLTVRQAPDTSSQGDAIYKALLSRPATTRERESWLKSLPAPEDLIWSLINTQQFIFVQ